MTSSKKMLFGLLGYPLGHSLSPQMHNAGIVSLKIKAKYKPFEIKPTQLKHFLSQVPKLGISGFNVTVPYKERLIDYVKFDPETEYLKKIGAVNTVVIKKNVWKGFNTDIPGFIQHLLEGIDPCGKRVAILGAGGASRAVSYALANIGAKEIAIFDIDQKKAVDVVNMIKGFFRTRNIYSVETIEKLNIREKDLLVNATPIGLKKEDPCLVSEELLHKDLFVYDLIYNPQETKLLSLAKARGARVSNGLGMLLYQGAISFEYFTGHRAPIEIMRNALMRALNKP